jgi:hypothetical protein
MFDLPNEVSVHVTHYEPNLNSHQNLLILGKLFYVNCILERQMETHENTQTLTCLWKSRKNVHKIQAELFFVLPSADQTNAHLDGTGRLRSGLTKTTYFWPCLYTHSAVFWVRRDALSLSLLVINVSVLPSVRRLSFLCFFVARVKC